MKDIDNYFSPQVFLIVLRETLESAIIISVLLAFVHKNFPGEKAPEVQKYPKKPLYTTDDLESLNELLASERLGSSSSESALEIAENQKTLAVDKELKHQLLLQIWVGGFLGLASCMLIGVVILWIFYVLGNDLWTLAEHYWEGTFSIIASIIISVMGLKILRVNKMKEKWRAKLHAAIRDSSFTRNINASNDPNIVKPRESSMWSDRYFMFILPFVTTLREGMEAVVFIGGIGINENTSISSILYSVISAIALGSFIGFLLYRLGNSFSLQWFLISSTCLLYLVAAGLFSKGVWNFELQRFINLCDGFDVSETGHGPGSYDIANSVWHVNCCNGELQDDGAFWMMFTAILGWTNSATYGSVISYILYWVVVILVFGLLIYEENHGILPIPLGWQRKRILKRRKLQSTLQSHMELQREIEPRSSISSTTPLQR